MSIAIRLNEIIKKRQPLVKRIRKVKNHLNLLESVIQQIEERCETLIASPDNIEILDKLEELNFSGLLKRFRFQSRKLEKMETRFNRGTVNVGVVGLMGQGKSTLLKSLSGLSNDEIPAEKGGACTAVRSTIYHQAGVSKAKVDFYDEQSFLKEVIGSYYKELNLGNTPKTLSEFATASLPPQPQDTTKKAMYDRLKNEYYTYVSKYKALLQSDSPRMIEIPVEEIQNYVVHKYHNHQLISFNHLAVKQVEIFCEFPNSEVERIGLIDIPGLGDLRVGDEELMLKTLAEEVDVVLFLRRPDTLRYDWNQNDTELYEKAKKALNDLDERAFMILNHVRINNGDSDNYDGCKKHLQTIRNNPIDVVDCFITDCNDKQQAKQVLDIILKYFVDNIDKIDTKYADSLQKNLNNLVVAFNEELEKANLALSIFGNDNSMFKEKFNEFIQVLSNSLIALKDELKQKRDQVDPDFEAQVKKVMKACEENTGIPSLEFIQNSRNHPDGKGSYRLVYLRYVAEMRCHISQYFLSLNLGFKKSLNNLKSSIVHLFLHQCNFDKLTTAKDENFLKEMADLTKSHNQSKLELGFRTLAESHISYEALIMADIRQYFDDLLEPDSVNGNNLNGSKESNSATDNSEKNVAENLQNLHEKVIDNCSKILHKYLTKPSEIKYFLTQEFIDRMLYAEGLEDEWELFLQDRDIRAQVWTEFQKYEERKLIYQQWRNLIQEGQKINQLQSMQFLV